MTDELTPSLRRAEAPAPAAARTPEGPARSPFNVRCGSCQHVWTAAWLPMEMAAAARTIGRAHCPACGTGPKGIFTAPGEAVSPAPPQRIA